jgi:hypothetical protein
MGAGWRVADAFRFLLAISCFTIISGIPTSGAQTNAPGATSGPTASIAELNPLIRTARDLVDPKRSLPPSDHALSAELDRTVKTIDDIINAQFSIGYQDLIVRANNDFKSMDDAAATIKSADCKSTSIELPTRKYNNALSDLSILTGQSQNAIPQENLQLILLPSSFISNGVPKLLVTQHKSLLIK